MKRILVVAAAQTDALDRPVRGRTARAGGVRR